MNTQIQKHVINTIAYRNAERENAIKVLEKAKQLNRKVRRALPGENEFSYEIIENKKQLELSVLNTAQVAKILNLSKTGVIELKNSGELPAEKVKGVLYYKRSDVLKLVKEDNTTNLLSTKEAAKYINMNVESFQHRKLKFNIPYTLKGKRNRYYKKEDLDQHLIDHPRRNMEN